ncbi:MAG: dihydroorotate dehydrogenase electron transfer subunit [Candidatus Micrarchaeota archaeon]|nr:dihydroorotate dehydrogenase electron transfer subunit [Candidatus Micrarchaeota archaeon]
MAGKKKTTPKAKAAAAAPRAPARRQKAPACDDPGCASCEPSEGGLLTNEPLFSCAIGQPQFPLPLRAKVVSNEKENEKVSLLTLDVQMDAAPGQFVMVWLPGFEEKPMSIAEVKPSLQLAIARAGPASTQMADTKPGQYLFIRGPLGQGYQAKGKRWLLVGGGYGFAPLRFVARLGLERGAHVESINGARTKGLLMRPGPGPNHVTTDDGSEGMKGTVVTAMSHHFATAKAKWDCVYCCGPEKMMEAVAKACQAAGVPCQLSVERYMKCGFGVCGHCAMDGWLSCWDGPAISGEDALANREFGKAHKDKAGRQIKY